jgi:hypothetical protein
MSKKSITLSPKHGVNPSITHCEVCGKEIGIALLGKLKNDAEAPRDIYMGLCDECQKVIDQDGLMIIEVRDGETGNNPYRTGRIVGVSKEFKERYNIKSCIMYMEQSAFSKLFDDYLNNKENEDKDSAS